MGDGRTRGAGAVGGPMPGVNVLDRLVPRLKHALHPLDRWRPWFRELQAYHRHLTWPEFWARYAMGRMRAKDGEKWLHFGGEATLERNLRDYYATQDYFLYRQAYYHRDRTWFSVLATMPRAGGAFFEHGCGIAPVSAWASRRRPIGWTWTLVDLPSPAFSYGHRRMLRRAGQPSVVAFSPGSGAPEMFMHYTTAVCLEVLEHVVDPVAVMRYLIKHLEPGGHLHLNFVKCEPSGLNLESAQRLRGDALALLKGLECLRPVTDDGGTGIYRRPL